VRSDFHATAPKKKLVAFSDAKHICGERNERTKLMSFTPIRALVFFVLGLPFGFIVTGLGFAVTQTPFAAATIAPWALAFAAVTGAIGGFQNKR
jgi:hypothetical protein